MVTVGVVVAIGMEVQNLTHVRYFVGAVMAPNHLLYSHSNLIFDVTIVALRQL